MSNIDNLTARPPTTIYGPWTRDLPPPEQVKYYIVDSQSNGLPHIHDIITTDPLEGRVWGSPEEMEADLRGLEQRGYAVFTPEDVKDCNFVFETNPMSYYRAERQLAQQKQPTLANDLCSPRLPLQDPGHRLGPDVSLVVIDPTNMPPSVFETFPQYANPVVQEETDFLCQRLEDRGFLVLGPGEVNTFFSVTGAA